MKQHVSMLVDGLQENPERFHWNNVLVTAGY